MLKAIDLDGDNDPGASRVRSATDHLGPQSLRSTGLKPTADVGRFYWMQQHALESGWMQVEADSEKTVYRDKSAQYTLSGCMCGDVLMATHNTRSITKMISPNVRRPVKRYASGMRPRRIARPPVAMHRVNQAKVKPRMRTLKLLLGIRSSRSA